MMKGGKEEDKIMGPLFPRLHVNDADKGGPRAPPRNKMALYEQLSIPSQRFNSASAPARPLPPYNAGTSISSASSNQGGGNERSVFSPFYIPQSPAQSAEMVQSRPFDATNLQSTRMELARSVGHANYKSSNAVGSVAECSSIRARDFSSVKKSCQERLDDEDDFRVPTFVQSEVAHSNKDTHVMETKRLTPLRSNSSPKSCSATRSSPIRFPSSFDNALEQGIAVKSRKHEKSYTEHNSKETVVIKENKEKDGSHLETREKLVEASNYSKACSDQEHTSTRHFIENTCQRSITVCKESGNGAMDGHLNDIDDAENEDASRVRSESCTKASFLSSHRSQSMAGNYDRGNDKVSRSVELTGVEKSDDVSETSMVDSISGLEISPDDVVGIIGPKQFWKARRAIVNQQRVFAVQLFELHRLIKVQKLIASSPHLLLEENQYLSGSPQKVPNKNLPPESMVKPQSQIAKQKDDSLYLNQDMDCRTENTEIPPLSSQDDGLNQGLCQLPRCGSYSGNPPHPVPVAPENRPTAWCYPPANHWLVPVMSPSEGLIYKPYTGPCPPAASFMAPVYGGCGPLGVPPVPGGFMNAAYGVPASHHQENMVSGAPPIAPNYFPTPYGLPVVNPNISNSAVEQVDPIMRPSPTGQIEQRSRNSCNMAVARSEAFSGSPWKVPASKDSELQGSTASSPFERSQGRDALPLFPTAPAMVGPACPSESHDGDHQSRVIKVVPHNARSATESAARIFRSIQEERQQF